MYIPSKGRPDCVTARYLLESGYPGEITIVIGDDDDSAGQYVSNFGRESVVVFDKGLAARKSDLADAWGDTMPAGVTPARNFIAELARNSGLERCWMFDDDYRFISRIFRDGTRRRLLDGSEIFDALNEIEEFGKSTKIPVVGFEVYSRANSTSGCVEFGNQVYNGFNMDVTLDKFVPFKGRLFEDGAHTMEMMRLGRTDFSFHHLYIEVAAKPFTFSEKKQNGGLYDTYVNVSGADEESLARDAAQVRNIGYTLLQAPTACEMVMSGSRPIRKRYLTSKLQVKRLSEKHARRLVPKE